MDGQAPLECRVIITIIIIINIITVIIIMIMILFIKVSHLGGVHYEGGLLHVLPDSKEGKEANTTLQRSLSVHETARGFVNRVIMIQI